MTPTLRHRNGTLYIDNTPIQEGAVADTYLTAEGTAGNGTITVKNILGFGINQILLFEDLGSENAEIILTHSATTPSGTTVTLASNLVKTHPVGSKVRVITYNQIELKRGTTTVAGSATALTTATTADFNPVSSLGSGLVAIDPTLKIQSHESSEHSSGYYFARYKNSITADFSGYTDAVVYGGWSRNTAGAAIDQALKDLDLELSNKVTKKFCYDALTECLTITEGKQRRWPDHYSYNTQLTTITAGDYSYTMPTTAYDTETNRSLLAVRVGTGQALDFLDPVEFEDEIQGVAVTTAAEAGSVGETEIDLTNAAEFADSGTITYFASGVQYSFTYTAKSGNTLTGIPASGTGSITQTFSSGDTMYQGATFGAPTHYSVINGEIAFLPFPGADEHGEGIYTDHATVATTIDSDGDTIDALRYDMARYYLTWRIEQKQKNNNKLDQNSGFYLLYKEALNDAIRTSPTIIRNKPAPRINRMLRR